jgi:hypothetical protein
MKAIIPFIPGKPMDDAALLSRFLPPIPDGIAKDWIENHVPGGSLVFDPFGTSPHLALEIARAGCAVLTCVNNPIARFLLSLEANPPREENFRSALAELARSRVGEERLEIHLKNLYQTKCTQCGNIVIADAFIWEREASAPYSKIYDCMHCGDTGEHPVIQADIELSQSFTATAMHRMRIIERITSPGEKERKNVAEALSVYQPRALYSLVTLINRLEALLGSSQITGPVDRVRENCLTALVLFALDQGNNLWSHPSGRPRPKQLSASPNFRENNIWFALENAVVQLASELEPVELSEFPNFTSDMRGITVFEGTLRNLSEEAKIRSTTSVKDISAVISAIPRHNQAYWTLSALWAGWIWGRETLGEFKSVLLRRRYDWSWHCAALNNAFSSIANILDSHTPMFGIISEADSSFIQSAVVAAEQANFSMNGISLRADNQLAQVHWDYQPQSRFQITAPVILEEQMQELVVRNGIDYLDQRGEPAPYISLHTSGLSTITENMGISQKQNSPSADEYSRIQHLIENSLTFKHGFVRHGGGEKSFENASLWHQEIIEPASILSDRVESMIYQLICENERISYFKLDQSICNNFPGFMTPDSELINNCIESYCKKNYLERGDFIVRDQDKPGKRSLEVAANCLALNELGLNLGFTTDGQNPVLWRTSDEKVSLVFHVTSSAEIGSFVFYSPHPASKSIIVIPGARANLLLYKLRNNFHLAQIIDRGWRFLKFRHLRHLLESPSLSRENLDRELELDPMTESPAQMRLL